MWCHAVSCHSLCLSVCFLHCAARDGNQRTYICRQFIDLLAGWVDVEVGDDTGGRCVSAAALMVACDVALLRGYISVSRSQRKAWHPRHRVTVVSRVLKYVVVAVGPETC